jgi:uncharacterized protein YggE
MPRILASAASVLALAACSEPGPEPSASAPWTDGPVIESIGRAFLEVPPNRARFSVTFEARDVDSAEASRLAIEDARAATEAIRTAAEGAIRLTADLRVNPYYEQERIQVSQYQEQIVENVHPDHRLGFVAYATVNAVTLDVALADAARGAALAAGPVSAENMYFYLEPTADDQRRVFAAAAADAQARAELAAAEAGARLGRLLVLQENYGPCLSSPTSTTGSDEYARYDYAAAPAPPPPPMAAPAGLGASDRAAEILQKAQDYELAADPDPQRVEARVCAIYAAR